MAGEMRERDDAGLDLVTRAARAVGRDGDVVAALGKAGQLDHRLAAAPAGGTTHGLRAAFFHDAGKDGPVTAGTDERGDLAGGVIPLNDILVRRHGDGQPVVPQAEDRGAFRNGF